MTKKFKPGDIVRLKSGGPRMTVEQYMTGTFLTGKYQCQWFSGTALKQGYFPFESLNEVKDVLGDLEI